MRKPPFRALPPPVTNVERLRRSAFTLIELLVVVAIIVLLVAILLPSLARARNQAQSTVCASRMREATRGAAMAVLGAQNDRLSTNFGWATTSLRTMGAQVEVFTCPSDPKPVPTPALFDRMYNGDVYHGESSADGPYNYMGRVSGGNTYRVNIIDCVDADSFGYDSGGGSYDAAGSFHGDLDVELEWTAGAEQKSVVARVRQTETAWRHVLHDYKGRFVGQAASGLRISAPLLWGSFGLNVSAGLKGVKGNPVLVTEYRKWGIFPEKLSTAGKTAAPYGPDNLRQLLRFRHGGRSKDRNLLDPADTSYQARQYINVGFLDSHVERMGSEKLTQYSRAGGWNWSGWYGRRPSAPASF